MEPNKLENEIREKLVSREIQPSVQAWDRLDAMLTISETKKEKKTNYWLYIAAGFVLFMGIGLFFINGDDAPLKNGNLTPQVVVSSEGMDSHQNNTASENQLINQESVSEENTLASNDISSISHAKHSATKKEVVAQQSKEVTAVNNDKEIGVAQNQELKVQTNDVNLAVNSEIKMILPEKTTAKPKLKVDPSSLLSQVEDEVDLSFRQKAIKVITKNYKSAKESLATRNVEQSSY